MKLARSIALWGAILVGPSVMAAEEFDVAGRHAHQMLTRLCDDFGGRLTGTVANEGAMNRLAGELRELGLDPQKSKFKMLGWQRTVDQVELLAPLVRSLRVAALSYTEPTAAFEAAVVAIGNGAVSEYPQHADGKVALLNPGTPLQMREIVRTALERRVKGILFIDREGGGQLLARTGSFIGERLPIPVFSITQEEGQWLQRLLERKQEVRVRVSAESRSGEIETANLSVTIKGRSPERVIVGAHFDSWDLGQGAMDNGLGVAQLYALARALHGRDLARTVELVWFNGEEQGLWGSRHAAANLGDAPIVAMINLDMVGVPIAVNALGDESLVPALERWNNGRGARQLALGVQNVNWFGSDHSPYQLAGVRAVTFNAPIPRESVRYYHDLADTIDKLPGQIVVDSTAIIGDLLTALIEDSSLQAFRRTAPDTEILFTKFGLERRMKILGYWPFAL
ncbi:MAG: M28 family metallopeptidase [Opitutus sp.]